MYLPNTVNSAGSGIPRIFVPLSPEFPTDRLLIELQFDYLAAVAMAAGLQLQR